MGLEKGAPRGEANLLALGWLSLVAAVAVLTLVSCRGESPRRDGSRAAAPSAPPPKTDDAVIDAALTTLRHEETALRARTDFATLPPSSRSLGANPYALAALPGSGGFVGILRGDSRLVLLDAELSEERTPHGAVTQCPCRRRARQRFRHEPPFASRRALSRAGGATRARR